MESSTFKIKSLPLIDWCRRGFFSKADLGRPQMKAKSLMVTEGEVQQTYSVDLSFAFLGCYRKEEGRGHKVTWGCRARSSHTKTSRAQTLPLSQRTRSELVPICVWTCVVPQSPCWQKSTTVISTKETLRLHGFALPLPLTFSENLLFQPVDLKIRDLDWEPIKYKSPNFKLATFGEAHFRKCD